MGSIGYKANINLMTKNHTYIERILTPKGISVYILEAGARACTTTLI